MASGLSGARGSIPRVIGLLIVIVFAALVYFLCLALGLPAIIGIIAALLVLLAGIGGADRGPWGRL